MLFLSDNEKGAYNERKNFLENFGTKGERKLFGGLNSGETKDAE